MLTEQEEKFITYWEQNRDRQKRTFRQLLVGIPIGLLFAVPIFINFVSGWYKRADMQSNTQDFNPGVLLIALLLIISFIAIFSKKHQWDMREQHYRELISKRSKNVEKENL
jgi:uncharacterized membrane protein